MASRFPIAACLWGIAACVFVYRYAMLPLDWQSPMRHVLPGIAIGLAFGARALWREARDNGANRPGVPVLLACAAAGAGLAFGAMFLAFPSLARAPVEKREFPGFELSVPEGEIVEDSLDYTAGKLLMKNIAGRRGGLVVQWEPGTPMTPEELKAAAQVIRTGLGDKVQGDPNVTSVPGPDGKPVDTIVFGGDDATFTLSLLHCGIRNVLVGTIAADDTLGLQRRIVASFVCRADPERDKTARVAFPLWLDLPGWYAETRDPDQLEITDGETGLLTLRTVKIDADLPLEKVLSAAFSGAGMNVTIGARDGDRIPLTIREGGEVAYGWARLFPCPRGGALVFGAAMDEAGADALYERVTAKSRCLHAREAPQEWPDPPAADSGEPAAPQPPATP